MNEQLLNNLLSFGWKVIAVLIGWCWYREYKKNLILKNKTETKLDIICLIIAYIGVALQSWWGFWSNAVYGMPFTNLWKFVITGGGLI